MKREVKTKQKAITLKGLIRNKEKVIITKTRFQELKKFLYDHIDKTGLASREVLQETIVQLLDILDEMAK